MSFANTFLSKSNLSLVYSILNKTIDERADKQLINYPELNIQDRLEGVMYKFSKKQDSRELAKIPTIEQRLTFMNKKVLEVCIPGFLSLVEQVESSQDAVSQDAVSKIRTSRDSSRDNNRDNSRDNSSSRDSSSRDSSSDGNQEVGNQEVDINRQFEALAQERKLEMSSSSQNPRPDEGQQFESEQDQFKARDQLFQERLERIQENREQTIQQGLENPSSTPISQLVSSQSNQNAGRNNVEMDIRNSRPQLHEIDTKKLFQDTIAPPSQNRVAFNKGRVPDVQEVQPVQEVHQNDLGNPRLLQKLPSEAESKTLDELVIIHASDRDWAGTWTRDSEGNDILSESPNPDRYRFPIKFSPSQTEEKMASIQKSFRNIKQIEIVDVMLSAHDNPCFEEFLVEDQREKTGKNSKNSKNSKNKEKTAKDTPESSSTHSHDSQESESLDKESADDSETEYEYVEEEVTDDESQDDNDSSNQERSEAANLEDDEYLDEDGLEEAIIVEDADKDPDDPDESSEDKEKRLIISFGESISVFQLYRYPYLMLDVQEFTGQLSSTNRFHRSAMTRLVVSRQFAPRGSEPLRGYIYLRSLVGASMSSLVFSPTPLPSLDMLTFSLLLPTGQRYGEEHQWNRDPLVIRSVSCIPKGVSGCIEIEVATPFFESIYATGDHILIKSLEFVEDLEEGGLAIQKNLNSFQEEIKTFLTRPEGNTIISTKRTLCDPLIPKPFRNKIVIALPVKMDRFCRCQPVVQEKVDWRMKGHLLNGSIQPVYTLKISYLENEFSPEQLAIA